MIPQTSRKFSILLIPCLVFTLTLLMKSSVGPYWLGPNFDPSYLYLFNSLYLVDGIVPNFTDHPGTTLQLIGALVIKLIHWGESQRSIAQIVIDHPELHLNLIWAVLFTSYIISLVLLGRYVHKKTNNTIFSLLVQTPALLFLTLKSYQSTGYVLPILTNVSAEALLVTCINLNLIFVIKLYYDQSIVEERRSALWLGITGATAVVTKITFFPLLLIPFFLMRYVSSKIMFVLSFFLGGALLTFPIFIKYKKALIWWVNLIIRDGRHGQGEMRVFNFEEYFFYLSRFINQNLFLVSIMVVALGLLIIFYVRSKNVRYDLPKDHRSPFLFLGVFLGVFTLHFFIIAKQGSSHYVVPIVGFLGCLLWLMVQCFKVLFPLNHKPLIIFLSFFIFVNVFFAIHYRQQLNQTNKEVLAFSEKVYKNYSDCFVCGYYRSTSLPMALHFGDTNAGNNAYLHLLRDKYPNTALYHFWSGYFHFFQKRMTYSFLKEMNSCVLLYGSPSTSFSDKGLLVEEVESIETEALYKVLQTSKHSLR